MVVVVVLEPVVVVTLWVAGTYRAVLFYELSELQVSKRKTMKGKKSAFVASSLFSRSFRRAIQHVSNFVMASSKGHPFWRFAINGLEKRQRHRWGTMFRSSVSLPFSDST